MTERTFHSLDRCTVPGFVAYRDEMPSAPSEPSVSTRSYQTLVGEVVVAWASIEHLLDALIEVELRIGGKAAGRRAVQSLSGKISHLCAAIRGDGLLAPVADRLQPILDRIDAHKDDRHRVAHGMVVRFIEDSGGGVRLLRLIRGFEKPEMVTLTTSELDAMAPTAEQIALDLLREVLAPALDLLPPQASGTHD